MKENKLAIRSLAEADSLARKMVSDIQSVLTSEPLGFVPLKGALIKLLEYLSTPEGRTDANCRAVNSFFMHNDLWVDRNLPDSFHRIFADMAGTLHDTISAPEIARNFDSTPEQLLKRAKELNIEPRHLQKPGDETPPGL